jgi:hypothetical protein
MAPLSSDSRVITAKMLVPTDGSFDTTPLVCVSIRAFIVHVTRTGRFQML